MDTHYISQIYRQRPASMIDLPLGAWFCKAHGIEDHELMHAQTVDEAKSIILKKGWDNTSANKLQDYNRVMQSKESR